jgi:hypothetical protein
MMPEEFKTMSADERNHYLRSILSQDHVITFTKVDGTERIMPCTLRTDAMPSRAVTEHHQTRAYNPEVLSVWCLDKAEWRSFKVMNVTSIKPIE